MAPGLKIEIIPHIGKRPNHELGFIEEIDMQQSYVLLNGRQCGWIGNTPGAPVMLCQQDLPKYIVDEIKRQVDEIRGVTSGEPLVPPTTEEVAAKEREFLGETEDEDTEVEDDE